MKRTKLIVSVIILFVVILINVGCNPARNKTQIKSDIRNKEYTAFLPVDAESLILKSYDLDGDEIDEKIVTFYSSKDSDSQAFILKKSQNGWSKYSITNPLKYPLGEYEPFIFDINDINNDGVPEILFHWNLGTGTVSNTFIYQFKDKSVRNLLSLESAYVPYNGPIFEDIDRDRKEEVFGYDGDKDFQTGRVKGTKTIYKWSDKIKKYVVDSKKSYSFVIN